MIKYHVEFDCEAQKNFNELDKPIRIQILKWLNKNVENSVNPRWTGQELTANKSGLWRYRVGRYRLVCQILDAELIVLVVQAGKRGVVFD